MRFEKALPALRAGNKIRRNWWTKGVYLKKVGGAILIDDETKPPSKYPEPADFDDEDVLATDWEVLV
jgi:hypothetical protein